MAAPGTILENQASSPSKGGLRAGRYELLSRLAAGGMGEVFIARQTSEGAFEKRVALKLLLPHLSHAEEFVHMFLDEARIAARMNHPNIVQIFDLGVAEGRYFIAMALVEGTSLARLLNACRAKKQPLPLPIVRLIANGLCAGLAYAHELAGPGGQRLGIIHRDVNPANVLVSVDGAVLLTDFGIAKAQDNLHRTRPGDVRGKYAYMAPEQMVSPAGVDHRADLFALGVTLYEAATLVSPFSRDTDMEIMDAVRNQPLADPLAARPDLTPGFVHALRRAAEKDPYARHASARELRDEVLDGPMASPHELGEWVSSLCAAELAAFRGAPSVALQEVGTRSLVHATRSLQHALPPSAPPALVPKPEPEPEPEEWSPRRRGLTRRAAMGAGFALGVLIVLVAVAARLLWSEPPPDAVAPAPIPAQPKADRTAEPAEAEPSGVPAVAAEPAQVVPAAVARRHLAKKSKAAESAIPQDVLLHVGYLSADATPWAAMYIEGHQVDRTPISRYPLTTGEHVLVFKNPDLGKEVTRRVSIEEGKVATVRVDFTK